ncbi:MAG: CvpA family protein, partial [Clostridiaceae bacterium]|nr:CvpA family protein [Clostridiaceae bacterium]
MADIVLFAFIGIMALWGAKTGFIKTVFHFGYYVISIIIAMYLYPFLSNYLIDSQFSVFVHNNIIMPRIGVDTSELNLPTFLEPIVTGGIENTTEAIANSMTKLIINIFCFILIFIILKIGLKLVVGVLDKIAKLPVLSSLNKLGGLIAGAANGALITYILLALMTMFSNDKVLDTINSSKFVADMYN